MNFQKIVVATDFSESSLAALETAFDLALQGDHTLYLVHVIEPSLVAGDPTAMLYPKVEKRLEALIPEGWRDNANAKALVLTQAAPAKAIAQVAREKGADLIVVGTYGRKGLTRMLMGSTAAALLRHSPCKVLVVKQKTAVKAA